MATITKNFDQVSNTHSNTHSVGLSHRYNEWIKGLEFSHFGLISMAILIGSCLGGIAAMYVLMAGMPIWAVGIGLAASLANLVASIAQAPTKWVVNMFFLSVIVNAALFIAAVV